MLTFGYSRLNSSAQSVIKLAKVSEPTEDTFPEIPLTFVYSGKFSSSASVEKLTKLDKLDKLIILITFFKLMVISDKSLNDLIINTIRIEYDNYM